MVKKIAISTLITIFVLFAIFHTTPNETTTDTKSAVKNAEESYKTDKVMSTTQEVMNQVGNQAIETSCNSGSSQACNTTYSTVSIASIVLGILCIVLFAAGAIGFAKWLIGIIP